VAKCLCSTIRPILMALGPASLFLLCQHHNCSTVLLPNHSPEIFSCIRKRSLGGYESLLFVVSLHTYAVQSSYLACDLDTIRVISSIMLLLIVNLYGNIIIVTLFSVYLNFYESIVLGTVTKPRNPCRVHVC
jgi:hypothetical protein